MNSCVDFPINDSSLSDMRARALKLESEVKKVIVGQEAAIRLMLIAIFSRGHVLLEGDVGVGKTTLLRAVTRAIGGAYERIEGTVDLMPNDLIYHTYISDEGKPKVEPGPLLRSGENISVFFFNEINRARPQVHSLMLRVMAERSLYAFKKEFRLPHLLVFADRNQVEKDETFEIPSAARDRFMMEIPILVPEDVETRKSLIFNTKFHDTDALTSLIEPNILSFDQLNAFGVGLQNHIEASPVLQDYVANIWQATQTPERYGIEIEDVDSSHLVHSGASPRGMGMLMKAARVNAWLCNRESLIPEDVHQVFHEVIAHRIVLNPMFESRRTKLTRALTTKIIQHVPVP